MERLTSRLMALFRAMDAAGAWLGLLGLRLVLAWEFGEAGVEKLHGQDWFVEIQDRFPFPLNLLPAGFSWNLATWFELLAPVALVLGLGTRLAGLGLTLLTLVAIASVHAGHGYTIAEGGWKLPLLYLAMLLPLVLSGPGKLSIDHWLRARRPRTERRLWS